MLVMVIVLYKLSIEESLTYQTMIQGLKETNHLKDVEVIIYDNSPESTALESVENVTYYHDKRNIGISEAYNFGLNFANINGAKWLGLYDQDTAISTDYLIQLFLSLTKHQNDYSIIVPRIKSNSQYVSPIYTNDGSFSHDSEVNPGVYTDNLMAINSASVVKCDFLNSIGGFNQNYPLDYLDHWLFKVAEINHQTILVMDITLDHNLSVMSLKELSNKRLYNILKYEKQFYLEFYPAMKMKYYSHYFLRLIKYMLKDPKKLSVGLKILFNKEL